MSRIFDMQQSDYEGIEDTTGFDACRMKEDDANQHLAVLDDKHRVRARCSIWWRDTAVFGNAHIGAIGHYAADNAECARDLLEHACRELARRRCSYAIGPLDGSTWRQYRFVTERGNAKPFYLEPDNPAQWPSHFTDNGFGTLARYVSELNPDFPNRQPALGNLRKKFADLGVTVEPINPDCPARDMQDLYGVVCEAFADSVLYSTLHYESFVQLYTPLLSTVDPQLMLVARHEGRIVGFVFSPPDFLQNTSVEKIDTIVIKTIAVLPRTRYSGLGRMLIVDMLQKAENMGYVQAISALMHTDNRSQKISRNCAGPMRGYELFARRLAG